jgi:uncharacterized protein (TIRG00374 family)
MQKYLRNALIFLTAVFALLAIMAALTNAAEVLKTTNTIFLIAAASFFIVSILIWLISWAYLIKKRMGLAFGGGLSAGFSAVYASLTPVQLGADALRAISLKERFGIPYRESIAASMVVKGVKFLMIAVISSLVIILFLFYAEGGAILTAGLLSGFFVVVLAALLFLLPLKKEFGLKIAALFKRISRRVAAAEKIGQFFSSYSEYLPLLPRKSFLLVAFFSAISLLFEFIAMLFCFRALGISIPLYSIAVLFALVSVLERTPFLPRGIGLVEGAGFAFLSMPFVSAQYVSTAEIGALLIIFDFVRIVLPSLLSIALYLFLHCGGSRGKRPE